MSIRRSAGRAIVWTVLLALLCAGLVAAQAARQVCPLCNGTGGGACSRCGGSGQIKCGSCGGVLGCVNCSWRGWVLCPECGGTGRAKPCFLCDGTGFLNGGDDGGGSGDDHGDDGGDDGGGSYVDRPGEDDTAMPCDTARGTVLACTKGNVAGEGVGSLFDGDEATVYRTASSALYVIWKTDKPLAVDGYDLVVIGEDLYFDATAPKGDPPRSWKLYGSPRQLDRDDDAWYEIHDVDMEDDDSNTTGVSVGFDACPAFQYFKLEVTRNFGGEYTMIAELRLKGTEKEQVEEPAPKETCAPTTAPTEAPADPLVIETEAPKADLSGAKVTVKDQTFTGKALKPAVKVKLNGKALRNGTDYTVRYSNNTKVGAATVKVTGKGQYAGTAKAAFSINPKPVSGLKLKAGKGKVTASWEKASGVSGYEIEYAQNKRFKGAKALSVKKTGTKCVLKKLPSKKTWYVRIRCYKTVKGKKYWSDWSSVDKAKTK